VYEESVSRMAFIIFSQGEFGYRNIPAGDEKIFNLFYSAVLTENSKTMIRK
jgi:hypothetical protein